MSELHIHNEGLAGLIIEAYSAEKFMETIITKQDFTRQLIPLDDGRCQLFLKDGYQQMADSIMRFLYTLYKFQAGITVEKGGLFLITTQDEDARAYIEIMAKQHFGQLTTLSSSEYQLSLRPCYHAITPEIFFSLVTIYAMRVRNNQGLFARRRRQPRLRPNSAHSIDKIVQIPVQSS